MNQKIIVIITTLLCLNKAICQLKPNNKADLVNSLFSKPDYNYLLPALDNSICLVRQEYVLIDTAGNEFGADNKPYWGFKYGLGIITDSGIYIFNDLLKPWTNDKDLDEILKTDTKHLKPQISKGLFRRSADKKFKAIDFNQARNSVKNITPKKALVDTAKIDSIKQKTEPDSATLKHLPNNKKLNADLGKHVAEDITDAQTAQNGLFANIPIQDAAAQIPVQINSMDTAGWFVQINIADGSELNDSSQFIYTIIKPTFSMAEGSPKMYVSNTTKTKGKIVGGAYFTAQFALGKIQFFAAGLAKEDAKGWYVNPFSYNMPDAPKKEHMYKPTPIIKSKHELETNR